MPCAAARRHTFFPFLARLTDAARASTPPPITTTSTALRSITVEEDRMDLDPASPFSHFELTPMRIHAKPESPPLTTRRDSALTEVYDSEPNSIHELPACVLGKIFSAFEGDPRDVRLKVKSHASQRAAPSLRFRTRRADPLRHRGHLQAVEVAGPGTLLLAATVEAACDRSSESALRIGETGRPNDVRFNHALFPFLQGSLNLHKAVVLCRSAPARSQPIQREASADVF